MKLLNKYKNGNYTVSIYDDGTKVRETEADEFIPAFPENIDLKISDRCDGGCPWCHEKSTINGNLATFDHEFLWSLKPGTELAIGGGNVLEHPQMTDFLAFCKDRGIIANITVNQRHALPAEEAWGTYFDCDIENWINVGLVHGVGISYNGNSKSLNKFFEDYHADITKNIVIHVINGVNSFEEIMSIAGKDRKILILGYKDVRKGIEYRNSESEKIKKNQQSIYDNMNEITKAFNVVSFDNLAIEQLNMRRFFTTAEWEEFFMGNEGSHTFYIDLVKEEFAINSCETNNRHKLLSTVEEMFSVVKGERK